MNLVEIGLFAVALAVAWLVITRRVERSPALRAVVVVLVVAATVAAILMLRIATERAARAEAVRSYVCRSYAATLASAARLVEATSNAAMLDGQKADLRGRRLDSGSPAFHACVPPDQVDACQARYADAVAASTALEFVVAARAVSEALLGQGSCRQ